MQAYNSGNPKWKSMILTSLWFRETWTEECPLPSNNEEYPNFVQNYRRICRNTSWEREGQMLTRES